MNETLPKLEDYLKNQKGKGKLKKIVNRKPKYDKNILRKYLYKWYGNAINSKKDDGKDDQDDKMKDLKKKFLLIQLKKFKKNNNKIFLENIFINGSKKLSKLL